MADEKILSEEKFSEQELDSVSGGYYDQDVETIELRRKEKEEMEQKEREAERKKELEKKLNAPLRFAKMVMENEMKYLTKLRKNLKG